MAHRREIRRMHQSGSRLPTGDVFRSSTQYGGPICHALFEKICYDQSLHHGGETLTDQVNSAPKSLRLHIAFFGRRNVGKSSLLNSITRQQVSIVSPVAGTTTDPVEKPMELLPLGPVLFIDTAGIDDTGELGDLRILKTREVLDRTDLAVLVAEAGAWGNFEDDILNELNARKTPTVVVFNKSDLGRPEAGLISRLQEQKLHVVLSSAQRGEGILDLRQALLDSAPADFIESSPIVGAWSVPEKWPSWSSP